MATKSIVNTFRLLMGRQLQARIDAIEMIASTTPRHPACSTLPMSQYAMRVGLNNAAPYAVPGRSGSLGVLRGADLSRISMRAHGAFWMPDLDFGFHNTRRKSQ
jgi:hypothetical protein